MSHFLRITLLAFALTSAACGGGGGSSGGSAPAVSGSTGAVVSGGTSTAGTTSTTSSGTSQGSGSATGSATGTTTGTATGAATQTTGATVSTASAPTTSKQPPATVAPASSAPDPAEPDASVTTIDLLALLTPGANARYDSADLRVEHMVEVANLAFEDSGVPVRLRLAGVRQVQHDDALDSETALRHLTEASDPTLADTPTWRREAEADLVVLFRAYANDGVCGLAWIGGTVTGWSGAEAARYGMSTVSIDCSDLTLAHELGHNLGLGHARSQNDDAGHVAWAAGFGVQDTFSTVMASPAAFNAPQLLRFSNPAASCLGHVCGVDADHPSDGADAVGALQMTVDAVAAYSDQL